MTQANLSRLIDKAYEHGFVSLIQADILPPGLNEEVIRAISAKKQEPAFMLEWRLQAYRHWLTMTEPHWGHLHYKPIDYQSISYYSAPKGNKPGSLAEVDPALLEVRSKLGIPLHEQEILSGVNNQVAVDAVFDSVSVTTTFQSTLEGRYLLCFF
jgi:Fe-S cluster assembly protein SufB